MIRRVGMVWLPVCPAFPLWVPRFGPGGPDGQRVAGVGGPWTVSNRCSSWVCQGQSRGRCSRQCRAWFAIRAATLTRARRTVAVRARPSVTDAIRAAARVRLNAIVLCVDEKSQIQALNRTQKVLPMQPGHAEQRTHDYVWSEGLISDRCPKG